ncbi:hypothetical protein EDEG_02573 [Edhazardia aedis USNM 41457]|uniref:Uncharacterized protein n=1 Tax=Edhazardia aedis (strain USNM 41457) TaxID=1003232 RepID=J9D5J9_EDHAE|nr:hypothetical protein EDEG_02573 [Edhazardia aedis USNM 41457]|eukprot:EJW03041.1 hypothetical protein EDEG_02573 [Edhazardia aedis USNM 41457]
MSGEFNNYIAVLIEIQSLLNKITNLNSVKTDRTEKNEKKMQITLNKLVELLTKLKRENCSELENRLIYDISILNQEFKSILSPLSNNFKICNLYIEFQKYWISKCDPISDLRVNLSSFKNLMIVIADEVVSNDNSFSKLLSNISATDYQKKFLEQTESQKFDEHLDWKHIYKSVKKIYIKNYLCRSQALNNVKNFKSYNQKKS